MVNAPDTMICYSLLLRHCISLRKKEGGYPDVQAFMATYRETESVVERYNRDLAEWEHQMKQKSRPQKPPERESVRNRLRQLQEQGRQQKPRKKSFDRER